MFSEYVGESGQVTFGEMSVLLQLGLEVGGKDIRVIFELYELRVDAFLRLGFFLSTSIRRWVACVNGFLTLFDIIRALQMQLITLGIPRQSAAPWMA